jgi:hypothetical protein
MRAKAVSRSRRSLLLPAMSLLLFGAAGCRSRPRPNAPPPRPAATVASVWEKPLHLSADVPLAVMQQRYADVMKHAGFKLDSHYPFQEVEIPLILRKSQAFIEVNWSGRRIECLLDTGCSSILWPQWLHLDSQQLEYGRPQLGQQGLPVRGEWVLSPRISIGDLHLTNVPTEAMGVPRPTASSSPGIGLQYGLTQPIIGMFAFLPAVMTIDYAQQKLTLRDSTYDVTLYPHVPHTLLIHYDQTQSGRIVLRGMLGGHKARFLLDSGEGWASVSAAFVHDHLASLPIQHKKTARPEDRKSFPFVGPLGLNISGMKYKALDFYVADQVGEADVYLGAVLFRACRVTIDPFRKVVLLERN